MSEMMNVRCPSCGASYRLDPARIPAGGARLSCPACNHRWMIKGARSEAAASPYAVSCPKCGHSFNPGQSEQTAKSVLVVDDQAFFRNFAAEALSSDYTVYVAKGLEEAVRSFEENLPSAVVLDLGLDRGPDDGKEVLKRLGGRAPVVILTGRTDFDQFGDDWRELAELGARELVLKGLTMDAELKSKVQRLIEES